MNRGLILSVVIGLLSMGCAGQSGTSDDGHGYDDGGWAVTTWGDDFEVFSEAAPLIVGEQSVAYTHVTYLDDFSPVTEGAVTVVLMSRSRTLTEYRQDGAVRDGVFNVTITPETEGNFSLYFRVEANGISEDIHAGRVRVGSPEEPGGLMAGGVLQSHDHSGGDHSHAADADAVSFLKEQQWKTPFRTIWTEQDQVRRVVSGTGKIQPVAGWESALTASLDGEVTAPEWPFVGMAVESGTVLFELAPRASEGQSLAELEALETEKRAELELATERLSRLEKLIELQATSAAEVEAAKARVTALTAQHDAALRNLQAVRGAGQRGGSGRGRVEIVSPFSGHIAEVSVTPGQVVTAGATLARVVQTEPFWVEVYLHPWESALLGGDAHGLLLRGPGMTEPVRFDASRVRLISRAPVVNDRTGTVTCVFEVLEAEAALPLGTAVEADVMLSSAQRGVVVPSSAIVDDAGIPIVYVQTDGEGFVRREVRIRAREGDRLLVDGLAARERLVTVGGATIRRSTLVSSDVGHGHVH